MERLRDCLANPSGTDAVTGCEGLIDELAEGIQSLGIDEQAFLRLAALNLTRMQFERIIHKKGLHHSLREISENPYLVNEEYKPGELLEDPLSGDKVDGLIRPFQD